MDYKKYKAKPIIEFNERTWPSKQLTQAPIWCSVDLRDGNQSLQNPMTLEQKTNFFEFLVKTGFKEIEVGFPSASETEFNFLRTLITQDLIPADVTIQVLTPARDEFIQQTFAALDGVKRAIVHLYNATSPLHRDVVFQKSQQETLDLAVLGAKSLQKYAAQYSENGETEFIFEYSPECFSQTEPDFAVSVCNEVIKTWQNGENGQKSQKIIINLPITVETHTPNVHADMVEFMCKNLHNRQNITVSLHGHNDRGTAVAATELSLLAGADRVEGTLFGNGERTGNADIITIAMNLYSHGINPNLDFSNIDNAIDIYTKYTGLPVHPRHPYAGDLVYTAFSGSHQDAIRKGMAKRAEFAEKSDKSEKSENMGNSEKLDKTAIFWEMPYLPIDPLDVGRNYDPIIRVNSQSGSAAAAYILETVHGIILPKPLQRSFGRLITQKSDSAKTELTPTEIYNLFEESYINRAAPIELITWHEQRNYQITPTTKKVTTKIFAEIKQNGERNSIAGIGGGIVAAFCQALSEHLQLQFEIKHYSQHALEKGNQARAITYIGVSLASENAKSQENQENKQNEIIFGAGVSRNIVNSSVRALLSAVNRGILEWA
ncbi:MAG: 2-isopropylmalate synthase [Defluviitaleaceae bacterium]|nr:2-isopropylmalate synthase [Defluviitaleaceae bacterium]